MRRRFHEANIVVIPCRRTLRRSQNNRNVRTCFAKSLTGVKLYVTSANKCQHCCGSMQTDAASYNIVGSNNVACCWPTMLRPFAWGLKRDLRPVLANATSHNIVGPNNVGSCWHLLALAVVHTNERNNCQHCWRNVVFLALITALSVPSFSSVYRPSHVFSSNNSLYLSRLKGKSFPQGQSAVPPRGLTIFWCIYSRLSIFCLNASCFLKVFAQLSLIRHIYNNPERRKRATTVCFLKKTLQGACADVFTRPTLLGFHANGCNIVALRFASHRTAEMLRLVGPKV